MRYLNKFENFDNDESRSSNPTYPEYNQASRLKASQYVDIVFSKGAGDEVAELCQEIGCKLPKDDDGLDEIKEKAVKYFIENPERMKNFDSEFKTIPYNGGDGVVRTNNIGGVHESKKPSPEEEGCVKISLNKDDMRLFSKKTQLISLINRNKVTLRNGEVWFNKDDNQTIKILNIFFEMDDSLFSEEEVNESFDSEFGFEILSIKRKRDGIIFRVGESYKDSNNHEYTIGSITDGGNGIFYLNAIEGGFINALNAIKM